MPAFCTGLLLALVTASQPVVLVEESRPRATIVVSARATAEERDAAEELARYVEKATGAKLPIANAAGSGARILVGATACPPEAAARVGRLRGEGFLIRVSPEGTVMLAGNGAGGTSFAVYTFLEQFLGVRWLWPGELGEVVPRSKSLRVAPATIEKEPAFLLRRVGSLSEPDQIRSGRDSDRPSDQWAAYQHTLGIAFDEEALAEARRWARRNRFGGPGIKGGHAFGVMVPPAKYGPSHADYYALVNGKRLWENYDGKHGAQLCTTHPEVIRLVIDYANRTFEEHPDYQTISISPNDGGGFCECERCRALDTGAVQVVNPDPEAGGGRQRIITDRMMTFANLVTEGVVKKHPDKKVSILGYGAYREPPARVKIHPSLNIQYHLRANMHWNAEAERKEYAALEGWGRAATSLGVTEFLIQGALADMPRLFPELLERSIRRIHELGYRYYGTQAGEGFATNGINYYVLGKLLWDPALDHRAILRDYFEKGFGPAAPAIGRYFDGFIGRWKEMKSRGLTLDDGSLRTCRSLAALYPPEFRAARRRELEEAARAAQGEYRQRVEFVERGLRYVDLTVGAVEKTIPLLEAGWKLEPKVAAPERADRQAFEAARAAWEARERFIETQKKTLALSYRWIQYNDHLRTFNPLWRMREWVDARRAKEDEQRARIRAALYVPEPLPPLAPQIHSRFEPAPGVAAERVTFGTEFGLRVPAIVYWPRARAGKIPALVVVNGHGGDKYSWYALYSGILYARAGAAVLTYDPIGEGERNQERKSGTRAHDKLEPVDSPEHAELARRQGGLILCDLMQAVSCLCQRPEVDPERIGAMGYSMGSFIVALAGALEPRLHACVIAAGGGLRIPSGEFKPGSKPSCIQGLPYRALMFLGDPPAALYSLHASRGPTLVVNGTLDWNGQPRASQDPRWFEQLRRHVADFRGSAEGVFEIGEFQPGAIHRPYFVTRPVALWLERRLDFPNWTEADIRAMPETHIGEWARSQKVEIDPLYDTEGLEAGTRALGRGVPGLTRPQLSVFTPQQWEREKGRLILESWLERVRR